MNITQEYGNLRVLNRNIRNTRKRLVVAIMKVVKPCMWETGYITSIDKKKSSFETGNSRHMKAYFFGGEKEKFYRPKMSYTFSMANEYLGIQGFTEENAIVLDAYAGGLVTQNMHDIAIEDLVNLFSWVERNPDKFKKRK